MLRLTHDTASRRKLLADLKSGAKKWHPNLGTAAALAGWLEPLEWAAGRPASDHFISQSRVYSAALQTGDVRLLRWYEDYLRRGDVVVRVPVEMRIYKAAHYGRLDFLKAFWDDLGDYDFKVYVDDVEGSATFWNVAVKGHLDIVRWFLSIRYRPEYVYDEVQAHGDLPPDVRQVLLDAGLVHLDPDDAQAGAAHAGAVDIEIGEVEIEIDIDGDLLDDADGA